MGGGICVGEWKTHLWLLLNPRSSPVGRLLGEQPKYASDPQNPSSFNNLFLKDYWM